MPSGTGRTSPLGEPAAERDAFGEVVLVTRLRAAIRGLNPDIPEEAREEALHRQIPLPAGFAGRGGEDGVGPGRAAVRGVGGSMTHDDPGSRSLTG
jgi:hypothetical protein